MYDDYRSVVANASLHDPGTIRAIVLHDVTRPIANLSYAIDRAIWGARPTGFHVTSVLLHVLNVVILFGLAWRLAVDREVGAEAERAEGVSTELVAFGSAALFAVHPMMTEAVGYISGRSEVLCATWFLLALQCSHRWIRDHGAAWAIGTIVLWIVALATKETAAMFPVVLAAYDWLHGPVVGKRTRIVTVHLPLLASALVVGLTRLAVLARVEHPGEVKVHWLYILMELDVVRRYVGLLVNPAGQAMFHDVSSIASVIQPASAGGHGIDRRHRRARLGVAATRATGELRPLLVSVPAGAVRRAHRVRPGRTDGRASSLPGELRNVPGRRHGHRVDRMVGRTGRLLNTLAGHGRAGDGAALVRRRNRGAQRHMGQSRDAVAGVGRSGSRSLSAAVVARRSAGGRLGVVAKPSYSSRLRFVCGLPSRSVI